MSLIEVVVLVVLAFRGLTAIVEDIRKAFF